MMDNVAEHSVDYRIALEKAREMDSPVRVSLGRSLVQDSSLDEYLRRAPDLFTGDSEDYLDRDTALHRIDRSPSQEIQKVKIQLFDLIRQSEHPLEDFKKIEQVFVKNNLPYVAKVFKVFEILHPPETLKKITSKNPEVARGVIGSCVSDVLVSSSDKQKYYIIYKDLLKAHVYSGNKSLKDYVSILQLGEKFADKALTEGVDSLSKKELSKLNHFLVKLDALYENSLLGRNTDREQIDGEEVIQRLERLKEDLGVKDGQSINDRVTEMFLKPIGIETLDQLKKTMRKKKREAHKRNLREVRKSIRDNDGNLSIKEGDLFKGIKSEYINYILSTGLVSYEYLGADSETLVSFTPLDLDVSRVLDVDFEGNGYGKGVNDFQTAYNRSLSKGYGDIAFLIKDRKQFQKTKFGDGNKYQENRYELFPNGFLNVEKHYGIRTGLPSTEIDAIIVTNVNDRQLMNKLSVAIATKGIYIPIVDTKGKVLFTPEEYYRYRKLNDGILPYEGDWMKVDIVERETALGKELEDLGQEIKALIPETERIYEAIKEMIAEELMSEGIELKDDLEFDWSVIGAELYNIGSTARHTNVPGDYDFDLSVILDDNDFERKALTVKRKLLERLQPQFDSSHDRYESFYKKLKFSQIRSFGSKGLDSQPDVDIGIIRRSKEREVTTDQAIQEKLKFIKEFMGDEYYFRTLANIVMTKKVLKEGGIYKNIEENGIAGIGVETWILANNGNMLNAFRSFYDTAHENDEVIDLERFKTKYNIINVGYNLRTSDVDNYLNNLTQASYEKMLSMLSDFLEKYSEKNT